MKQKTDYTVVMESPAKLETVKPSYEQYGAALNRAENLKRKYGKHFTFYVRISQKGKVIAEEKV